MIRVRCRSLLVLATVVPAVGCMHFGAPIGAPLPIVVDEGFASANPIIVPVTDHEFAWNQLVDTVDDYFRIAAEDRVRIVGGVFTEGRIETYPVIGATLLEPWRRDSASRFERIHSTLQPIRRRGEVRITPVAEGYSISVAVFKELEDVSRPEHATVGGVTHRHDGSLVRTEPTPDARPVTLGWIPQGRDLALEQRILEEIQGRLAVSPVNWQ